MEPDYKEMCIALIAAFDEIASYLPPSEYLHEYDRQACSVVETARLIISNEERTS